MQMEATPEIYGRSRARQDGTFKWCCFLHSVTEDVCHEKIKFHFQTWSPEGFIDLSGHAQGCDLRAFTGHIPVSSRTTENLGPNRALCTTLCF